MGKVTCLITRGSGRSREVVVFDHPLAGTQLPAGTLRAGEDWLLGALREGWEETGLPRLRVVQTVDEPRFAPRRLVQLQTPAATPAEWWVVTPDGGGLCWRCRWAAVDGDIGLVEGQAEWLEVTAPRLLPGPVPAPFAMPDHPICNDTSFLQFWAFPPAEKRSVVSWVSRDHQVDDDLVRRALVVCRTPDGLIVLVSGNGRTMWNFPGGGREPGEALIDTAAREVSEEACAAVADLELIGYQHVLDLDDDDHVVNEQFQARYAAHVELRAWRPAFEIAARRLVPLPEVRRAAGAWWQPQMLDHVLGAAAARWGA